jgi:hypothetical protein
MAVQRKLISKVRAVQGQTLVLASSKQLSLNTLKDFIIASVCIGPAAIYRRGTSAGMAQSKNALKKFAAL